MGFRGRTFPLSRMQALEKDPARRIQLEELMRHGWVTANGTLPLATVRETGSQASCLKPFRSQTWLSFLVSFTSAIWGTTFILLRLVSVNEVVLHQVVLSMDDGVAEAISLEGRSKIFASLQTIFTVRTVLS
jgi:hypothetical protein